MLSGSRIILASLLALVLLIVGSVSLVVDTLVHIPDFSKLRDKVEVTIYLPDGTKTIRWFGPKTPEWVPYNQISNALLSAVVASEDTTFYQNEGVDYHELKEALKKDLEEKRFSRGASTITQQLVKNVYLGREKTLWRKIKEFIWARELAKQVKRSEILCFYVNLVEWGPNIYGIRQAANHYFHMSAGEITARQAAFLAMLLPSPIRYHIYYEKRELTHWASSRISQILNVMHSMGFIDSDTYQAALNQSLWGEIPEPIPTDLGNLPSDDTGIDSGTFPTMKKPTEEKEIQPPSPVNPDEIDNTIKLEELSPEKSPSEP